MLQARRDGDPMREHELRCFAARLDVPLESLTPHDLAGGPPSMAAVRAHDALMIGGSGDHYVSKDDLPELERTLERLREIAAAGHPTFGSCFGYHLMVRALGGVIVHDPERSEVGTFELRLTDAGLADPLFGALPARFDAQLGHRDRATAHPAGVENLAASERSPLQALRVPGQPIWATQFHPELERETCVDRYRTYLASYGTGVPDADAQRAIDGFRESPHASDLLRRFVQLVFG